jgi:hypothetical protein
MDAKAIETLAINAIRERLVLSDRLDQFIQENDKEPSVDGFVNLYSPGGKTKENYLGRVAVQIFCSVLINSRISKSPRKPLFCGLRGLLGFGEVGVLGGLLALP